MTDPAEEAAYIEKLYEYGEQLNNAKDKSQVRNLLFDSCFLGLGFWIPMFELAIRVLDCFVVSQNVQDYQGIIDAAKTSVKAKQLAAQLIPKFYKFFPDLSGPALDAHLDLVEAEELGVRIFLRSLYIYIYIYKVSLIFLLTPNLSFASH